MRETFTVPEDDEFMTIREHDAANFRYSASYLGVAPERRSRADPDLHVIANHARPAPARRHGAGIGIGERDLLVRRGEHLLLDGVELFHLLADLLFQMRGLGG